VCMCVKRSLKESFLGFIKSKKSRFDIKQYIANTKKSPLVSLVSYFTRTYLLSIDF
jgi:hypothetical protein